MTTKVNEIKTDKNRYSFRKKDTSVYKTPQGLNRKIIKDISDRKKEPSWMIRFRLKAYSIFQGKTIPDWGADLTGINFSSLNYYARPAKSKYKSWDEVPREIKDTYERIGVPEAERKFLAGVGAQYDSEMIYSNLKKQWTSQGVVFLSMDEGLKQYPEMIKEYFGTVIPPEDNKFAALNSAVWSGGSFIYVPKNVQVTIPLQAYFRINAANLGQFERTLIIADEYSSVQYLEGCTAPIYSSDSLHAGVVEVIVKKGARVRYTTVQNWSNNVYNLVTKRMVIEENGIGEWIDANIGSKITMKYPCLILKGRKAKGEILSLSLAGSGQHQDTGGKAIHLAPNTSSIITSKSISLEGGRTSYRGLVKVVRGATGSKSHVRCDALIMDKESRSDTNPTNIIEEKDAALGHEASVAKVDQEQLFYLMSRGLNELQAVSLIINGFIEPIVKELPLEYAAELNRLVNLSMEYRVG